MYKYNGMRASVKGLPIRHKRSLGKLCVLDGRAREQYKLFMQSEALIIIVITITGLAAIPINIAMQTEVLEIIN